MSSQRQLLGNEGAEKEQDTVSPQALLGNTSNEGSRKDEGGPTDEASIPVIVSDLLSLVIDLVRYGKLCDRIHDTLNEDAGIEASKRTVETIQELMFEVFVAVMRLALAMASREKIQVEQTIRLLLTVRLPRIARLAAECEITEKQILSSRREKQLVNDMKNAIIDQIKDLIARETGHTPEASGISR
ncbi:hypothetical protein ONZ43_g4050 [Nemania bipapillata]|uniref:Uncharacterized protein n=1 Tax=Nemania bipapillata TaxID=110536 RepID=A0ACC2ISJ5_9PEZI|nr:hypothetical protein ONZ43_g4050 [Nemania bipapillata]